MMSEDCQIVICDAERRTQRREKGLKFIRTQIMNEWEFSHKSGTQNKKNMKTNFCKNQYKYKTEKSLYNISTRKGGLF